MYDLPCTIGPDAPPEFDPIPRKLNTCDGWTAARQRAFVAALAACGSVRVATQAVGMSYANVHRLRQQPGAEGFCRAWDAAVEIAARRIQETLIEHALHGVPEIVTRGKSEVIERRRFNHRTMMWLLTHHMPERYGKAPAGDRWRKPPRRIEEVRASILTKLAAIERQQLSEMTDPAERAAHELLHGPQDWDAIAGGGAA